jgi:hypothetical protein
MRICCDRLSEGNLVIMPSGRHSLWLPSAGRSPPREGKSLFRADAAAVPHTNTEATSEKAPCIDRNTLQLGVVTQNSKRM